MSEETTPAPVPNIPADIHGKGADEKTLCGESFATVRPDRRTDDHAEVTCPQCVAYIRQVHDDAAAEAEANRVEDEFAEAREFVAKAHGPGARISRDLADELNVTLERFAEILGLDPALMTGREFITGELVNEVRVSVRRAQARPTGLTLDTYDPSPIVLAAISYSVKAIHSVPTPREALALMTPIMAVAAGVVLADLVEQGVAPYADGPGVQAEEIADEEYGALMEWLGPRLAQQAIGELLNTLTASRADRQRNRKTSFAVMDLDQLRRLFG